MKPFWPLVATAELTFQPHRLTHALGTATLWLLVLACRCRTRSLCSFTPQVGCLVLSEPHACVLAAVPKLLVLWASRLAAVSILENFPRMCQANGFGCVMQLPRVRVAGVIKHPLVAVWLRVVFLPEDYASAYCSA